MKLSFIIPTYNDEKTIRDVIAEADKIGRDTFSHYEILVINDGSFDKTGEILATIKNQHVHVVTHKKNRGYGATIKELYEKARYDWIFSLPGDYQIHPKELLKLLPYKDRADMIVGWRVKRNDPPMRLFQSWAYNTLLKYIYGLSLHDVNSVRLVSKKLLKSVRLESRSAFVDAELCVKARKRGFKILEVPIDHRPSISRGSGAALTTTLPTILDMLRFRL
ncbi:hypothetical protein A3A79_01920 [Candidatus Gottesmanbacteria bacterium RIFCSPLOWO2_01_FULL_43_11b]|uniref:Glycosyltransferase 2-like domain-containing protein n=1 Tax=Candidatus Gottesmanbacteria bacterium RIFCSPLOWO2_01_FULL_43_11b TaxID=1798392 RepID=A0A1F6AI41_9BACT|nr:MAG: hypothetical protein A3A79_01920 [Candidatus Gottesmanbacteria bacterium RIFCSPLOWO2_01_FULL_43_11b]